MELDVRPGTGRDKREEILERWYRQQLQDRVPALFRNGSQSWAYRSLKSESKKMKTRWGTCNNAAGRIWLNLELAKKPITCTEYIVVHELVHLIERSHNGHFRDLMDRSMPQWSLYRDH